MYETVISDSIFEYWKKNKEKNDVWRAARFLYLSNYSYLGECSTLRMQLEDNSKKILLENIEKTYKLIQDVKFTNVDFRNVLKKIIKSKNKNKTFVYADPPYLDKKNNYSDSFTIKDTEDLFNILIGSGYKFAISEFPSPPILELVKKYKLNKIEITERRTLNNRSLEILITNYNNYNSLF